MSELRKTLQAVQSGELDVEAAMEQLRCGLFDDLKHSRVDHDRLDRNGAAEVIYGQGKSIKQITEIMKALLDRGQDVLVTRLDEDKTKALTAKFSKAETNALAGTLVVRNSEASPTETFISIVCAGTSDLSVAEEARVTAEFYGNTVKTVYDAGVAGLHRLIADLDTIRNARVVVTVAGMEGALPSVVAGLVKAPVIAVPTSVGYGASFGGVAALLAMLNSCASGLSVVNIDNGFGAGYLASMINRM